MTSWTTAIVLASIAPAPVELACRCSCDGLDSVSASEPIGSSVPLVGAGCLSVAVGVVLFLTGLCCVPCSRTLVQTILDDKACRPIVDRPHPDYVDSRIEYG